MAGCDFLVIRKSDREGEDAVIRGVLFLRKIRKKDESAGNQNKLAG